MVNGISGPTRAPRLVVADRGNPEATITTCRAVRATTRCEMLVMTGGDAPGAFAGLESMPGVHLVHIPGAGQVALLNAAIDRLAPDDIVRVDPGVGHLSDGWLDRLLEVVSAHPAVGIAGVKVLAADRRVFSYGRCLVNALGGRPHHANTGWMDSDGPQYGDAGIVDAVAPAAVFLKRALLDAVGPYDQAYDQAASPLWIEQDDLCLRGWAAGWATVRLPHATCRCNSPGFEDAERLWRDGWAGRNRWRTTWGWDVEFPNLHDVRARWQDTLVCRDIGRNLLDEWSADPPDVDIFLTTRNRLDRLKGLIPRLAETDYPRVHLYVFNDASTDGTHEYLEALHGTLPMPLHVVHTPSNVGTHAGLNWLVAVSESPLVVRLDDEVTLPRTWLSRFVDTLRDNPYAGVVGGKLCAEEFPDVVMNADTRWHPAISAHTGERDTGQLDYVSRVSVIFGSCLVYRRKAIRQAGPFVKLEDDMHHVLLVQRAGYDAMYDGRVRILHPNKPVSLRTDRLITIRREELFETYGRDVYEILDTALDLAGRRDADPGEAALRTRLRVSPIRIDDGLDLARMLAARGRRQEALSWLNAVVASNPDSPDPRLARAAYQIESNHLEEAREDINRAGDSPAARVMRARVLLSERRFAEAESTLATVAGDETGEADAVRGALAHARGDAVAAAAFLRRSLTVRPSVGTAVTLALACRAGGDGPGACAALAEALTLDPSATEALALHRALHPPEQVACFATGQRASRNEPLDIVFYAPWGLNANVPAHTSGAEPAGSGVALAEALAAAGHRVRVFADGLTPAGAPAASYDRHERLASACTADRPDVVIGVRTCRLIADQRFAPLQVVWADGPPSRFLVTQSLAHATFAGIDLWICRCGTEAGEMRARFGMAHARLLVLSSDESSDRGSVPVATAAHWEAFVREALGGETAIVQRVVQHLAAGRVAVAHRILNAEARPATVDEPAWTRLQAFVAWHAGLGDPPDDDAVAALVRAFGPLRRRIGPDGLGVKRGG